MILWLIFSAAAYLGVAVLVAAAALRYGRSWRVDDATHAWNSVTFGLAWPLFLLIIVVAFVAHILGELLP